MKYSLDILCSKCGNSDLKHVFYLDKTLKAFNNVTGAVLGCPICNQVMAIESYDRSRNQYFKIRDLPWGYKEGKERHEKELKEHGLDYVYTKRRDRFDVKLTDIQIKDFDITGCTPMTDDPSYCSLNLFIGDEGDVFYRVRITEKELIAICKIVEKEKYKMFKEEYTK